MTVDLNKKLTDHFALWEFSCKCFGKYHDCQRALVLPALPAALERLRTAHYPTGLTIVSGYRCGRYNAGLNGAATDSQHTHGTAVDILPRATLQQVRNLAVFSGIGVNRKSGLVSHVDVRHAGRYNLTQSTPVHPAIWYYNK